MLVAQLTTEPRTAAVAALERSREHLLSLQDERGWWRGELQTNVTMDAEDILLREFLGIREAAPTERSAAWIRSQQRDDGSWTNFYGGPGDLSTTVEAYWALRLAGDPAGAQHMRAAAAFIRAHGGVERARVFTHLWLALFGLWSWESVPSLPVEVMLLPPWMPLSVYDFACWARQTIVALAVVKAHRPVRRLDFDLAELHVGPTPAGRSPADTVSTRRARGLRTLDRVLRSYERRPFAPLRRLAMARAERWIVRRQEADGSWGGIQPPWVYSLIALHLRGYPLEHPVFKRGLDGLERFMVEDRDDRRGVGAPAGESRRLEACQSPVWDTALAIIALCDGGLSGEHPAIVRACEWLLGEEVTVRGDWSVVRPRLQPGGWAFEFANVNYPDVDDTAEVVLALRRVARELQVRAAAGGRRRVGPIIPGTGNAPLAAAAAGAEGSAPIVAAGAADHASAGVAGALAWQIDGAVARALTWLEGMQSSDGGWGAFDADNTRALVRELPFLDFGEVIDEPSADVTAHAIEMLGELGRADTPAARRGLSWLLERQEPDGSWWGRWGVNHVYGTGAVVPALVAAGVAPSHDAIRRAVAWLESVQNKDGGWGEDPRSYDDPRWVGRGESTPSQTAWALLALHAAGERCEAVTRGVRWLVDAQRPDGGWDEPQYTAPSSRPTTTSTTTSTGSSSRSSPSAAACAGTPRHRRPSRASAGGEPDRPRADRRASRRRGDGAGVHGELSRGEPCAAAEGARRPARDLRLRQAGGRARRHAPRRPWRGARLARAGTRPRLRGPGPPPAARPPAGDAPGAPTLARAIRAADRGEPNRPAREPLRDLVGPSRLLRSLGRPGRGARAGGVRPCHTRPGRAVGLDLHGPSARRALPGRRRGPGRRTRVHAARGPRPVRLHDRGPRPFLRERAGAPPACLRG